MYSCEFPTLKCRIFCLFLRFNSKRNSLRNVPTTMCQDTAVKKSKFLSPWEDTDNTSINMHQISAEKSPAG